MLHMYVVQINPSWHDMDTLSSAVHTMQSIWRVLDELIKCDYNYSLHVIAHHRSLA